MRDAIDRQAAIDAVETKIKKWNAVDGEGYHVGIGLRYTDVIDTLTELPSALPEQWIPCSERLPEIGEHYVSEPCIVYCSNGAYGFAELEENIFGQVGWNCERDDEYHEPLGEVVAWMPLPEPYKEEQE